MGYAAPMNTGWGHRAWWVAGENPRRVLAAALGFFALGGRGRLAVVIASASWWLVACGAAALVAAWFYTGGKHPYGYAGWGVSELMVSYSSAVGDAGNPVGASQNPAVAAWLLAAALGLLSCALLMVNNLRDIPTDAQSGKRTLAVRLGIAGALGLCRLVVAALVWPP
ncbi:UbiA family prenyltransferase [Mobiluncus mulieris]|uniref:UbiA family prenyltransferase n=1 Tax=Mobiluncus mulieris TaxID=2052 RepID=UPI00209229C2|nr:UbiA family prenyltransferase [Mobiluncus mulieris]